MSKSDRPKANRLNLRLNDAEKTIVERAAALKGLAPGTFARDALLIVAHEITETKHEPAQ